MEQNKDQSGAAVRGEAVAAAKNELSYKGADGKYLDAQGWEIEHEDFGSTVMVPIHRNGVVIALVVAEWTDDFRGIISENCRILCDSPRAADAPSEPSELMFAERDGVPFRHLEYGDGLFFTLNAGKSRAADALDSQTKPPSGSRCPCDSSGTCQDVCPDPATGLPLCASADCYSARKPKSRSIGDDAQFWNLMSETIESLYSDALYRMASTALVAYIHEYFRAPAAPASATIQAAPDDMPSTMEDARKLIQYLRIENDSKVMELYDIKKKLAATIQEPVMVAEPVLTADEQFAKAMMVELARMGTPPEALRLAAQVFGIAPCPKCDFYAKGCKCPKPDAAPMVAEPMGHELMQQLGTMRAVLHTTMLRAYPDKSHAEITAEIDRSLGAAPMVADPAGVDGAARLVAYIEQLDVRLVAAGFDHPQRMKIVGLLLDRDAALAATVKAVPKIRITLRQARLLVDFFGGHDADVTVTERPEVWGQAEEGLYAFCTEYPEEGAQFLGATEVDDELAKTGLPRQQIKPAVDLIAAGALRQFKHNDGSPGLVFAYDKVIVDRELAAPMVADPAGVALRTRYEKYMDWCQRSGYDALTWPEFVDSRINSGQRHHAPITYGIAATVKAVPSDLTSIRCPVCCGSGSVDEPGDEAGSCESYGCEECHGQGKIIVDAEDVKAVPSEALELAGMVVKATFGDHKILVPRVDLSGKGIGTLVYFAAPQVDKTGGGE